MDFSRMYSSRSILAITAVVVQPLSVLGHMLLAQPPRIGQINNSPLDGPNASGGGSYPCKYNGDPSFYANPVRTTIPLGSNYTVKFTGSAVHGGGSCQFSLSKDLAPTAASTFKVIYSIQGGCPARNTPGNLGGDASMANPFEYPFTMPSDLEPGQYTFAWTWLNKVGNREFYMNCAAVDVTATSDHKGKAGYYDTLPDIAVANLKGVDCVSQPDNGMGSFKYQKPGQFVETNEALQTVDKQCFAPIAARQDPQSSQPASQPSTATSAIPVSSSSGQTVSPGIFVSKSTSSSVPSGFSTIAISTTKTTSPISSASGGASGGGGGGGGGTSCPPTWQSCTASGFFCIDTTHFGLCSFGCMPQVQSLAAGVGCDMKTNTLYDLRQYNSTGY